jgi:hypothetical protein
MTNFRFKLPAQVALESLQSAARTFAELKEDIKNSHLATKINFDEQVEMRNGIQWKITIQLIEKNTRASFGKIDDAVLPQGDTIIFFVLPFEHKGGVDEELLITDIENGILFSDYTYEELEDDLNELGYNALRKIGTAIKNYYGADFPILGKRHDILFTIIDWLSEQFALIGTTDNSCNSSVQDAIDLLLEAVSILKDLETDDNFVDTTTLSDLHVLALELQRQINS